MSTRLMVANLRVLLRDVDAGASEVAATAEQLASGARQATLTGVFVVALVPSAFVTVSRAGTRRPSGSSRTDTQRSR